MSAINAERFYFKNGYDLLERSMFRLTSGVWIASVVMAKTLRDPPLASARRSEV